MSARRRVRPGSTGGTSADTGDVAAGVRGSGHAAVADGERIRPGVVGQPYNTGSSLAFVVAALPMARRALGGESRSWPWAFVAGATALVGIGSVGFHGPGNRPGKVVHDLGVAAVAASLPVALVVDRPRRVPWPAVALGTAAVATHVLSRTGRPLAGSARPVPGHAVFHLLAAAALAAAVPDPESRGDLRSPAAAPAGDRAGTAGGDGAVR